MAYDDDEFRYQPPPKSPIPAAIFTSLITTVAVFFGLRALDERGLLPGSHARAGGEVIEVPSLLGMRPEQAREILKGRDLLLSIAAEREDAQYPAGSVAAQQPLPGSQAPRGTAVQATVSRGIRQVQVPNIVGLKIEDALKQLVAAGLQAAQRPAPDPRAAVGVVTQTDPVAGAPLAPQGSVTVFVGAAQPKSVPKVVGMRLSKARKLLEDEGFAVGKIKQITDGDRVSGAVLQQEPAAGASAAPGTAVDLVVNSDD